MNNAEMNINMDQFYSKIFIISIESWYFPIHHALSKVSPSKTNKHTAKGIEWGTPKRQSSAHLQPNYYCIISLVQVSTTHQSKYHTPTCWATTKNNLKPQVATGHSFNKLKQWNRFVSRITFTESRRVPIIKVTETGPWAWKETRREKVRVLPLLAL